MTTMNPEVNSYFSAGCGRCPLVNTPECKVHTWHKELAKLRLILLDCGLKEELKWAHPCYTVQGKNVALLGAFKEYCTVSFLKGALLQDAYGILRKPGENSQSARVLHCTDVEEIIELESVLKAYIFEAIEVEKAGLKVQLKTISERTIPEELQQAFDELPAFKTAFQALTPGRQRGYLLHFSQPKQSKTRASRIEQCMPQIFDGKGLND
jgi:uncharacterized protein YdeI (YjbR/CyaY-like superfamily)